MKQSEAYRIKMDEGELPSTSTLQQLRSHIKALNSRILMGNIVFGNYELTMKNYKRKTTALVSENKKLNQKLSAYDEEKFPPMDKIKDLPVIADEDLPFLDEDNSLTEDLRNEI